MPDRIIGARGPPVDGVDAWMGRLRAAALDRGLTAQAMDASHVCGPTHLESALVHARRAFERGNQFSRTVELEWVLCAAGVRQVGAALARVGIREGTEAFALLFISPDEGDDPEEAIGGVLAELGLARDDGVLVCTKEALEGLGVGPAELDVVPRESWQDLALERTALLDLER